MYFRTVMGRKAGRIVRHSRILITACFVCVRMDTQKIKLKSQRLLMVSSKGAKNRYNIFYTAFLCYSNSQRALLVKALSWVGDNSDSSEKTGSGVSIQGQAIKANEVIKDWQAMSHQHLLAFFSGTRLNTLFYLKSTSSPFFSLMCLNLVQCALKSPQGLGCFPQCLS